MSEVCSKTEEMAKLPKIGGEDYFCELTQSPEHGIYSLFYARGCFCKLSPIKKTHDSRETCFFSASLVKQHEIKGIRRRVLGEPYCRQQRQSDNIFQWRDKEANQISRRPTENETTCAEKTIGPKETEVEHPWDIGPFDKAQGHI